MKIKKLWLLLPIGVLVVLLSATTSFAAHLANGLIAYWPMDDATNPTADGSGHGNPGTLFGPGATFGGGNAAPIPGNANAIDFDGGGTNADPDYVSVVDAANLTPTGSAISLSAWIYPENIDLGNLHMVFGKWNDGHREYELMLQWGKVYFYASQNNTNAYASAISNTTLTTGSWYHVAGVWDGSNLLVYINGVSDGSSSAFVGPIADSDAMLTIGAQHWNGVWWRFFDGVIDEACVFDRALSPVEIALFAGGLACDETVDITLAPDAAFNPADTEHAVTATISPVVADIPVVFEVTSGSNAGDGATDLTASDGTAAFAYTGDGYTGPGIEIDDISACVDLSGVVGVCDADDPIALASKTWFDVGNPASNFCPSSVGTIKELTTHIDAGVIVSSSIDVPVDGGAVGVYFLNMGSGDITFDDPAWSTKTTGIPRNAPTMLDLTPTGSTGRFNDLGWGGAFVEGDDLLGCVEFSNIVPSKPGGNASAHIDLAFWRDGALYEIRVNFHFR